MTLAPGTDLGPYRIEAPIGAGGMGAVWKARDTRLDRTVAIKTIPGRFSERFEREAKTIASLNHPHICTVFDVGENYLVMEYIEGAPLNGPLPVAEVVRLGAQIAEALDAAHRKGITHRDLKPANVLVTKAGAKVIDFGLAKSAPIVSGETDLTITRRLTSEGTILGTVPYMSPEQLHGQEADARSDIFALGCVLYEMLTGKRAFEGKSQVSIMAAILEHEPAPLSDTVVPPWLDRVIRRCLRKDPDDRWQSARDVAIELRDTHPEPVAHAASSRAWLPWAVAGVLAVALVAASFIVLRPREQPPLLRTSIMLPESLGIVSGVGLAISPDGKHVAFVGIQQGKRQLWIRDLDSAAAHPLPGTDSAYRIFWSPDSRSLAFCADRKLKRIDIAGGPVVSLAECSQTGGGTWSRDGVIVAALGEQGLVKVPAAGGTPVQVFAPLERGMRRSPYFLPDGLHFLYTEGGPSTSTEGGRSTSLIVSDLQGKTRKQLLLTDSNAAYAEPGYLLYVEDSTLMARPFHTGKLELTGDAVPIVEGVANAGGPMGGDFSVSSNGILAYNSATNQLTLKWFDRSGKASDPLGTAGRLEAPAISPGGDRVAFNRRGGRFTDIWLYDIERGIESRHTSEPGGESHPVWSPDGSYLAYMTGSSGNEHIYRVPSKGIARAEDLGAERILPTDWSRDGRYILGDTAATGKTRNDLRAIPLFGDRKSFSFIQSEFQDARGKFSLDGDWVAYMSNQTGRAEVYVASFPEPKRGNKVSVSGGDYPIWSRDGKEIYYMGLEGTIWAAEVRGSGPTLTTGAPKPLFQAPRITQPRAFDVSKDGRFLIPVAAEESKTSTITLIQNWTSLLRRQ